MHLGIDLGTSNSAVAGYFDGQLKLFKSSDGSDVLPSALHIDRRGHKFVGKRAYDQSVLSPENTALGFKRRMGSSSNLTFAAAGLTMSPEDCSAEILRELVRQAQVESGRSEVTAAVVTTPAAFNQMQCEATVDAAGRAGLEKVALLQEPIAAAMAAMRDVGRKSGQFLVYDLGGGTFDLALVSCVSGSISILGHEGINMLGGRDFDRAILNEIVRPWLRENFSFLPEGQPDRDLERVLRVAQLVAERAKIDLSSSPEARIFAGEDEVRARDRSGTDVYLDVPITRSQLDSLVRRDVERTIELSRKLLAETHVSSDELDRIVFIGGPTKMPLVRQMIPAQLGVPADLNVDPMTAVALGAAIFAESRDWTSAGSSRKRSRATATSSGAAQVRLDYPERSAKDKERVRVQAPGPGFEVQVDSDSGWSSGRRVIAEECAIEVPLSREGSNQFRATISVPGTSEIERIDFSIARVAATVMAIPASLTLAVKVRESAQGTKNTLHPFLRKGTSLPTASVTEFRAAHDLKPGSSESLDFEVFQVSDERVLDPELNLHVGNFSVSGSDLPEGSPIRAGDAIQFHWSMTDSGILSAKLEVPDTQQSFEGRFFVPDAGHRTYDGDEGRLFAETMLESAERDLERAEEALGASPRLAELRSHITQQRSSIAAGADPDTNRRASEEARDARQNVSRLLNSPENRKAVLANDLREIEEEYEAFDDETKPEDEAKRFSDLATSARDAIRTGTPHSLDRGAAVLDQMRQLSIQSFWRDPAHVLGMFKYASSRLHLAMDKQLHLRLVAEGLSAMKSGEIDGVRRATFALFGNQADVGGGELTDIARLASILRG
ncbi:MAG: hypothetical protein AMXMBFR36_15070 [Acidobacteriota bacterium]